MLSSFVHVFIVPVLLERREYRAGLFTGNIQNDFHKNIIQKSNQILFGYPIQKSRPEAGLKITQQEGRLPGVLDHAP